MRRKVLTTLSVITSLALLLFFFNVSSNGAFAKTNNSEECTACEQKTTPDSFGPEETQKIAKTVVYNSTEFHVLERELNKHHGRIDTGNVRVYAVGDHALIHLPIIEDSQKRLTMVQYVVDTSNKKIMNERKIYFKAHNKTANLRIYDNSKLQGNYIFKNNEITDKINKETFKVQDLQEHLNKADDHVFKTQSACEYWVGILLGAGSSAACYGLCIAAGLATGIGGLACSVICAVYANMPVPDAIDEICG